MSSFIAFIKKEMTEQMRSGKLTVLVAIFVALGIMNPAVAKLTPWLIEMMSETLAENGMTVTVVSVSALDSWAQFFKNVPIALIAFVLLQSSIFTKEYSSGTLVLSLTKGLERYKVVLSKSAIITVLWTAGYWLCFIITYGYNAYFWDNSVAKNLGFSVVCWWVFGVFVISLTVLFSVLAGSNTTVLLGTGGAVLVSYLLGFIPKIEKYLPTALSDGSSLVYGFSGVKDYVPALVVTATLSVICFSVSIPIFNKKQL